MFSNFTDPTSETPQDDRDFFIYDQPSTSSSSSSAKNHNRLSLDSGIGQDDTSFEDSANLSSFQDTSFTQNQSIIGSTSSESPPTKWARISTTPPKTDDFFQKHTSIFSPPSNRQRLAGGTLRTPKSSSSGISIRLSTPSPFRVTISKTPLKLSNNQNVSDFQIGKNRVFSTSTSKRCVFPEEEEFLNLSRQPQKGLLNVAFEGFNELPIMTPSKLNEALECGLELDQGIIMEEERDLNLPSTSYSAPPIYEDPMFNPFLPAASPPKPPQKSSLQILDNPQSFAIITRGPLYSSPSSSDFNGPQQPRLGPKTKKVTIITPSEEENLENRAAKRKIREEIEEWRNVAFLTPEKDLAVNSPQWIAISTGRSLAQRQLFF
ncbi:unnamed protein product [Caenorhabditis angaria]|uniref:Uncharacterized protein n=1 Tax=Caenorhabditis angaria TaxID=860376 RepID=A0A9P1IKF6_9PELO|nr:unnamed protein product [Caenorhabditis angaria]